MVEKIVIDKYISESSFHMNASSQTDLRNMLVKFFQQKEFHDFAHLTRADVIDMYSSLKLISINSFMTHRSKMKDFSLWMYEHNLGTQNQIDIFSTLKYTDVNLRYVYDLCYFLDCDDLFETLQNVFEDFEDEFDTFKAGAILRWMGFEIKEIVQILKKDLHESDRVILRPSKPPIELPDSGVIIDFLVRYRDADSFSSNKMGGGRIVPYANSSFLIRSYKNAQFTEKQLLHSSAATKKYAEQYGKLFQWKSIYLSGLYYRINEYEKQHGLIGENFEILRTFFLNKDGSQIKAKNTLTLKYQEYELFKKYMYE